MLHNLRKTIARWVEPPAPAPEGPLPEQRALSVDMKLLELARGVGDQAVTPSTALSLTSVFAAINVISTDVAMLPMKVYRRLPSGGREEVRDHPVAELLAASPDGETTPMRWRQALMGHVLGHGNAYAEIGYTQDGRPARLHLLDPGAVTPRRTGSTKSLYYDLGNGRTLYPSRTLHVAGLGWDGLRGYSPIELARRAVGLGLSLETFATSFFGNGSRPGGILSTTGVLSPDAAKNLRESFEAFHRGADNAGKVAVLEQGAKFEPISVPPEDAQFIQSRQFQVVEIARLYRLPPHKLGDYSQSHLANIEAANLDYLTTTLAPWLEAIEQEVNLKLFTEEERRAGFYAEHSMAAFLRGDMRARAEFYTKMRDLGAMSPNEVRARENLNPIDGGDTFVIPLNLGPLADAGQQSAA